MTIIPHHRAHNLPDGGPFRMDAHACRIYGYAAPRKWNLTAAAIASALSIPAATVRSICREKRWPILLEGAARQRTYDESGIYKAALDGVRPVDREFR